MDRLAFAGRIMACSYRPVLAGDPAGLAGLFVDSDLRASLMVDSAPRGPLTDKWYDENDKYRQLVQRPRRSCWASRSRIRPRPRRPPARPASAKRYDWLSLRGMGGLPTGRPGRRPLDCLPLRREGPQLRNGTGGVTLGLRSSGRPSAGTLSVQWQC